MGNVQALIIIGVHIYQVPESFNKLLTHVCEWKESSRVSSCFCVSVRGLSLSLFLKFLFTFSLQSKGG